MRASRSWATSGGNELPSSQQTASVGGRRDSTGCGSPRCAGGAQSTGEDPRTRVHVCELLWCARVCACAQSQVRFSEAPGVGGAGGPGSRARGRRTVEPLSAVFPSALNSRVRGPQGPEGCLQGEVHWAELGGDFHPGRAGGRVMAPEPWWASCGSSVVQWAGRWGGGGQVGRGEGGGGRGGAPGQGMKDGRGEERMRAGKRRKAGEGGGERAALLN